VVHDLSSNPLGRALPLAEAMAAEHEVTVVGGLPAGREVNAIYRTELPVRTTPVERWAWSGWLGMKRIASLVEADVIVACKPLPTTLGAALLARNRLEREWGRGVPIVLDVEDDEWAVGTPWDPKSWSSIRAWLGSPLVAGGPCSARLAHRWTRRVDGVTVVSRAMQARYGGDLLRHGPSDSVFDPSRFVRTDRAAERRRLGLPIDRRLALFAGTPRRHKGVDVLIESLGCDGGESWDAVIVCRGEHRGLFEVPQPLASRVHVLVPVDRAEMAALLWLVDAVPVTLLDTAAGRAQVPAKLLDAMAMARPVVVSRVGDMPEIVGQGERGAVVNAGDAGALASALGRIGEDVTAAERCGRAGRAWYEANASPTAIRRVLGGVIERALVNRRGSA